MAVFVSVEVVSRFGCLVSFCSVYDAVLEEMGATWTRMMSAPASARPMATA